MRAPFLTLCERNVALVQCMTYISHLMGTCCLYFCVSNAFTTLLPGISNIFYACYLFHFG